jgi:RNA polymerase sigma factor (sigma-70 family)
MPNPAGYLYRVGQTAARRQRRQASTDRLFPVPDPDEVEIEPGLLPALERLSERQRICVVLVHGYGYGQTQAAELLDISPSSVRTHLDRGMRTLREQLEVTHEHR